MRLGDLGEFGLIARIAPVLAKSGAPSSAGRVALGIGDDAALLEVPLERQLVATVDTLVEGVHFRREWTSPEDLGWKSLAVNVSDIAAMGAEPLAALLSLALPEGTTVDWVDRFAEGMAQCGQEYGCAIVGGDTVRSPLELTITVTLLGTVEQGRALLRSGARVGDRICVTGTLGDSAAGLSLLMADAQPATQGIAGRPEFDSLLVTHHRPRPRLAAAHALAVLGAVTAMMDLSDGLASDLRRLTERSGVGARVWQEALPISEAARAAGAALGADPVDWALHGGEEYELLFTLPVAAVPGVTGLLAPLDVSVTVVGEIAVQGLRVIEPDGEERALTPEGFKHFGL